MSPWGTPFSSRIFIVRCPPINMQANLSVKNNLACNPAAWQALDVEISPSDRKVSHVDQHHHEVIDPHVPHSITQLSVPKIIRYIVHLLIMTTGSRVLVSL